MEAALNHLWQSTLFAALIAVLCFALRSNTARVRHLLWLAASVKFLVPFSLLVSIGSHVEIQAPAVPVTAAEQIAISFAPMEALPYESSRWASPAWPPVLASIWLLGSIVIVVRWSRRWLIVRNSLRSATPLPIRSPVIVYSSPTAIEPGVFGIVRSVLLLPEGITGKLSDEELDSVIAHELAHVRRRDNLTAALHMFVEATFWFHPLVWWIGARLVEERERACDEEVLRLGTRPQTYAEGILNVCKFYLESPLECTAGVTGADLKRRIGDIMTNRISTRLTMTRKLMLAAAGVSIVSLPVFIGVLKAQTKSEPLAFEVASIRPSDPSGRGMSFQNTPDNGIRATGVTLRTLIEFAYDIDSSRLSGGPGWMQSERFDINAKPEKPGPSDIGRKTNDTDQKTQADRLRERTRTLLADRFHLVVKRELAERSSYALVLAKNGHKLKPATAESGSGMHRNRGLIEGDVVPASMLAKILTMVVGRPVVDETGITGKFNFRLEWTESGRGKDGELAAESAQQDAMGASIFAAIQDQLGLKLEARKAPVEVIVIERAEKPTEN